MVVCAGVPFLCMAERYSPLCGSTAFSVCSSADGHSPASSLGCHKDRRCEHWCASLCGCVSCLFARVNSGTGIKALPMSSTLGPSQRLLGWRLVWSQSPAFPQDLCPPSSPIPAVKEHKSPSYRHNQKTNAVLTDPQSCSYYRTIQSIILLESTILNTFESGCLLP